MGRMQVLKEDEGKCNNETKASAKMRWLQVDKWDNGSGVDQDQPKDKQGWTPPKSRDECFRKTHRWTQITKSQLRFISLPNHSSKKHFCLGGMAPSERTRSVRAVRDTTVVDYSASHITLLSPFHHFFSPCWSHILHKHSGVWPTVTIRRNGLIGYTIASGLQCIDEAAKISPCVPSTLTSRSVGTWEVMILPSCEDPRNCMDPRNLGQSEWDQKLGKIEFEFSLYDKRRWKWDDVYLLRGPPNIYSPSLCPPPLPLYLRSSAIAAWRCTWSCMFEVHLETEIEWTQRCTWMPGLSEFGDVLGGRG